MGKQTARMENWWIERRRLRGDVFGHPRLYDGLFVTTSTVISINFETGICETRNTIYQLGKAAN